MGERARRFRDGSTRYSIDTLFPGLSNNSTQSFNSTDASPIEPNPKMEDSDSGCGINPEKAVTPEPPEKDGNMERSKSRLEEKPLWSGGVATKEYRSTGAAKRKASSPLKPTTQPKQIYPPTGLTKLSRKEMFEAFQPWVLRTYGDSAKTKTITKKKYTRILKTLRGEEINNAENSKFRFWTKSKGFHIGPPAGQLCAKDDDDNHGSVLEPNEPELYVPTTVKDGSGNEQPIYKKVAVVEQFFDIIYTVHVETEAKNGKHAGQKRTYRAITEKYAFLPREAVTKFLLQCTECQKRGSPGADSTGSSGSGGSVGKNFAVDRSPLSPSPLSSSDAEPAIFPPPSSLLQQGKSKSPSEFDINFGLPLPTSYTGGEEGEDGNVDEVSDVEGEENSRMVKMSHSASRKKLVPSKVKVKVRAPMARDTSMDTSSEEQDLRIKTKGSPGSGKSKNGGEGKESKSDVAGALDWLGYQPLGLKKEAQTTNNNIYSNGKHEFREQSSPLSLSDRQVNHEPAHDETSSNGNKDDEDDDDDESEDKIDTQQQDPERLKAFNMFVRLFVDENLDRMVPISKQPKEKIQAIIDSCTRQFPEFAERARKRIRTYLKSCRRNKRSRDGGWESTRPTPAHLTSVQAEQILAQACENESQNAKRMRMGLEPVSQPLPTPPLSESRGSKENGHHHGHSSGDEKPSKVPNSVAATIAAVASNTATANSLSPSSSSITATASNDQNINLTLNGSPANGESLLNQHPSSVLGNKGLDRSPLVDYSRTLNGAANMSMYRPNFSQTFQRPSPFPSLFPAAAAGALGNPTFPPNVSPLANGDAGPTDLSMKSKPLLAQKLNATELATVRQLITGYRESAAFLLRSADELEQLLIQQQ